MPSDIAEIRAKVQGTRNLGAGADYAAGLGINVPRDTTYQTGFLDRELSKKLSLNQYNQSRDILSRRGSALGMFQDQATNLRRGREGNVRNVRSLMSDQAFESDQSAKNRETAFKLQDISARTRGRSLDLSQQYANYIPGNPLVRMLATLGGTIGTSLLLRRALNRTTDPGILDTSSSYPIVHGIEGPTYEQGYYPQIPGR